MRLSWASNKCDNYEIAAPVFGVVPDAADPRNVNLPLYTKNLKPELAMDLLIRKIVLLPTNITLYNTVYINKIN